LVVVCQTTTNNAPTTSVVDEMELMFHLIHHSSGEQYWFDNT